MNICKLIGFFISYAVTCFWIFKSEYIPALSRCNEFPGDYIDGETPDTIPNSEAKTIEPMIV